MPQIPEKCEFDVEHDQIELKTQTNGDYIEIRKVRLGQDAAAALAYLINADNHLSIEIKLKEP
jgi:hypothetical protein